MLGLALALLLPFTVVPILMILAYRSKENGR